MRHSLRVALVGVALCYGCGDDPIEPPSPAPVAGVTLSVADTTVLVLDVLQIVATPRDSNGTALEGRRIDWLTSDDRLATVVDGQVQSKALGVVTITARSEGVSASVVLTMSPKVTVSRRLPTTLAGDTTRLFAALTDAEDRPYAIGTETWSSSDASVATVSSDGIVTGVSRGTATITARATITPSSFGLSGSVELMVLEPRLRPNREISYRLAGSQNLRRVGSDGGGDIQLTDPAYVVDGYDWSPSGERLALSYRDDGAGKSGLYTMDADGSDERELVPDAGQKPRWSPDGSSILMIRGSPAELFVINGDGTGLRQLTGLGNGLWNHEWSPDGRRIGVHGRNCSEFWILDYQGLHQQQVHLPTEACEHTWSPDGKLVAYFSVVRTGTFGVWLVNSDGSDPRPLTSNCSRSGVCGGDRNYYHPRWSPDGGRLAFVSYTVTGEAPMAHIFDLDRGAATEFVITAGLLDHTVEWSPDGTLLAFSGRHANGRGAVVVSQPDGSGQVPLTPNDVDSEVPVWRR